MIRFLGRGTDTKPMSELNRTTAGQLAGLMAPTEDPQNLWGADELRAIWRHQLTAPLEFDVGGLDEPLASQWRSLSTPAGSPARTFRDLLSHPTPPVALLDLVKEFGKAHSTHPESLLPREISMALYYTPIAVALVRCGQRLSSLPSDTLREGLRRVSQFPWLDEDTRALIQRAAGVV